MALELSVKADLLKDQTNIEQQLILEIDGIPFIYGAITVTKLALYGDDIKYGDAGLVYGGGIPDPDGRAYISLEKTTRQITQQLEVDKGGVGSVQRFNVQLVDKNQEVTQAFRPGEYVDDILSREANVYVGFGGSHPEDSVRIFNGIITSQQASPGSWIVGIDHPEYLKRQDLFTQVQAQLDGAIGAGDTSLTLKNVAGTLVEPGDSVRSYVRIDDELIEFSGVSGNVLTGLTRGSLTSVAASHDDEADAVSFYTLSGDPIDLALKLMLSNDGNVAFKTGVELPAFEQVTPSTTIENGLVFNDTRIKDSLGLEIGDLVSVSGATEGANNFTDGVIAAFVKEPTATVIIVSGPTLVVETGSSAVASFKSKYNTLPTGAGCGMSPSQVDVAQHLRMKTLFPSLPDYEHYIKDTINAKEFITNEVYFPAGFYQVPRKGRSSVNTTIPPLVLDDLVELNNSNTEKAATNKLTRGITKNFYNSVVYKFNVDSLDDRYLAGEVQISQRSKNRINTGNKSLTITSNGFRDTADTRNYIKAQTRRFLDRWQFGAESIQVETNYKSGFPIEVADIVLFGNADLQIPDVEEGSRDFKPRLMEVVNKKLDIRGKVSLELLDTGVGLDGRFGVISPNSFVGSGSTTSKVVLKASFGTGEFELERDKWTNFLGEEIRVRNTTFTYTEVTTLQQFDPETLTAILVDPPLSGAPAEDLIIDLPDYPDNADADDRRKMKNIHNFFTPVVDIVSGISTTVFEVAPADIDKFLVDAYVIVHNDSFSDASTPDAVTDDLQVVSIDTGTNRVTVSGDMGFTPSAGYKVNLIGFKDGGLPYRLI